MKFGRTALTFLLIASFYFASAQRSSIKAIFEVPVHFGIGYEGQISNKFSAGGSVGVLTSPNSDIVIGFLKFIGKNDALVLLIEDAFQLGIVGELNFNYNFGRNYVGAFAQAIGVQGGNASVAVVEDYFNIDVDDYPMNGQSFDSSIKVRTRLYQAGLLYGHRFPLKNKRFVINAEVSLSANIGSTSRMYSDARDFTALSNKLNEDLDEFYTKYAFIPSFGVMLVYKLNMDE